MPQSLRWVRRGVCSRYIGTYGCVMTKGTRMRVRLCHWTSKQASSGNVKADVSGSTDARGYALLPSPHNRHRRKARVAIVHNRIACRVRVLSVRVKDRGADNRVHRMQVIDSSSSWKDPANWQLWFSFFSSIGWSFFHQTRNRRVKIISFLSRFTYESRFGWNFLRCLCQEVDIDI